MYNDQGGSSSLPRLLGSFILVFLCLGAVSSFIPMVTAEQVPVEIQPVILDGNISVIDHPGIITGGGTGYYLVHSNAEGADVYFNHDWYQGKIENGTLLKRTCLTCTPVWTYTVKKCGYFALTQNNTRYPHQDEVIDLYANLTQPEEPLIPDFTANITVAAAPPLTVGFTSHAVGIVDTWNWSFGDGTYSEEENPVHTYTTAGVYTVSLSGTNSACQNNTLVKKDYITVHTPPKPTFLADFTVTPASGTAPLTVKCTDKSIGKPSMIIYDFGDGVNVTGPNPVHSYKFPGVYTITQTITKYNATSNSVMSSSVTKTNAVTVNSVPTIPLVAKFTASPVTGTAPLKVSFIDQSTGSPTFLNYDFGDGATATGKNPVHTYQIPGVYNVTLTVFKFDSKSGSLISDSSNRKNLILVSNNSPQTPVICNQPYGLCTIAKCEPMESDPTKAICNCLIEDGVSLGMTSCGERQPIDIYNSATGGWMIRAGALTGKITSTYSFVNALPKEEGKIPNRDIDPNYTGNIILKYCDNPVWANCLDMKCAVPPADPNDNTSVDRKAADYAVCECAMVTDTPIYYMASAGGEESCTDPGLCKQYTWSAAYIETMNAGIGSLRAYLAAHPNQDTAQQYVMPICESCEN